MEQIDYRILLKRYMRLVRDIEGTSFVEFSPSHNIRLTDEEIAVLGAIEAEARSDEERTTEEGGGRG